MLHDVCDYCSRQFGRVPGAPVICPSCGVENVRAGEGSERAGVSPLRAVEGSERAGVSPLRAVEGSERIGVSPSGVETAAQRTAPPPARKPVPEVAVRRGRKRR